MDPSVNEDAMDEAVNSGVPEEAAATDESPAVDATTEGE